MDHLNFQNFFRYIAPGGISILFYLYLRFYEYGTISFRMFKVSEIDLGEGIVLLLIAALLGYVYSNIYHGIINTSWMCRDHLQLRINHRDFFASAINRGLLLLELVPENGSQFGGPRVNSLNIANRLSSRGAAMLFDSLFYRMRRNGSNAQNEADESRFESFFHVWHGLGTTITGCLIVFICWCSLGWYHNIRFKNVEIGLDIPLLLLPCILFLIASKNWWQLRRMNTAYVEGWFLGVLSQDIDRFKGGAHQNSSPLTVLVRPIHLNA